ncbi:MAG: hypothetical protein ACOY90_09395 [Candidatus Zhuqueibacterota bacterium]
MKRNYFILTVLFAFMSVSIGLAQENITVIAPSSEIAEGLDLSAVGELFREAENLESFEKSLNDPEIGVNNLDLNGDGYVDYIRVVEDVVDETHVIILQVPLGEDDFQDVATIEVERTSEDNYNMQIRGNEVVYGPDYYIAPAQVHVHTWPIIVWIYRPVYRPYRSIFYFGYYPHWWRTYHPVPHTVYYTRTTHYRTRTTYVVTRTNRVETVHKVKYVPRSSTLVKKPERTNRTVVEPDRVEKKTTINKSSRGSITDQRIKKDIKPKPKPEVKKSTAQGSTENLKKPSAKKEVTKITKPETEAKKVTKKKEVKKSTPEKSKEKSTSEKGSIKSSVEKKKIN